MAFQVSPGVLVQERDLTNITRQINSSDKLFIIKLYIGNELLQDIYLFNNLNFIIKRLNLVRY